MAYTYNGDIVSSVLECGKAMYDKFLDENGNFHKKTGKSLSQEDDFLFNYMMH